MLVICGLPASQISNSKIGIIFYTDPERLLVNLCDVGLSVGRAVRQCLGR